MAETIRLQIFWIFSMISSSWFNPGAPLLPGLSSASFPSSRVMSVMFLNSYQAYMQALQHAQNQLLAVSQPGAQMLTMTMKRSPMHNQAPAYLNLSESDGASVYRLNKPGAFYSSEPWHIGLHPDHFLMFKMEDGSVAYGRNGQLMAHIDTQGQQYLGDCEGHPVLNDQGESIFFSGSVHNLRCDNTGCLYKGDGTLVARLGLATSPSGDFQMAGIGLLKGTLKPVADDKRHEQGGALETSNFSLSGLLAWIQEQTMNLKQIVAQYFFQDEEPDKQIIINP